jgi:hypothetical protein
MIELTMERAAAPTKSHSSESLTAPEHSFHYFREPQ